MTKEEIWDSFMGHGDFASWPVHQMSLVKGILGQYAKRQAITFDEWRIENRWFSFEQGHYYHTFEQGTSMSEGTYRKHYVKTREQLYDLFIESQNKQNDTD